MKTPLLFIALILYTLCANAQQKNWDVYNKDIDNEKLLIRVNTLLYDVQPTAEAPFLLKITHSYKGNGGSKLPTKAEAANLIRIQDVTKQVLSRKAKCYLAGTAAHNRICEMYFYVNDTTGLRQSVLGLYKNRQYKKYDVVIKPDYKWDGYFSVLYPGEEQRQLMYYKRVVARLLRLGDKLKKPHKVTHWAFFKNEEDMRLYEKYLQDKKYTLIAASKKTYARYQVSFYHITPITPEAILGAVKEIKTQMTINAGLYGGWQTIVAVR